MTNSNKKENKETKEFFTTKLSRTTIISIVVGSIVGLLLLFIIFFNSSDNTGFGAATFRRRPYMGTRQGGSSHLKYVAMGGIPGVIILIFISLLITEKIKL